MDPVNSYGGVVDAQLLLQAAATLTATGNGTALDLGAGRSFGGGGMPVQAAVSVSAIKTSAADETYAFKLQDSPDNATWRDVSPTVAATATGVTLLEGFQQERYARLVRTIAGTSPTITIGNVYLQPKP